MGFKFNIGAGDKPIEGYTNLDKGDDIALAGVRGVEVIYSSHFLEYFTKPDALKLLQSWFQALLPGGELFVSVPDFAKVVKIYDSEGIIMDGALYGKLPDSEFSHKSVYDKKTLRELLLIAGFRNVKEFEPFHDDCSRDYISLNLGCVK